MEFLKDGKQKITQYLANMSVDDVVLVGDFNMPPCPALDRLTPGGAEDSPLSHWAYIFGLTDVWKVYMPVCHLCGHVQDRSCLCQ